MDEKREWVRKLQEEAEIPEIVWKKAEQTFEKIQEEEKYREIPGRTKKKARRRNKRTIAVIIAAAVLMVSTLTVGAARYFYWNDNFSKRYNVSSETEKKLNDSNTAKEMNQYTEHDGIRIEAVQSVADSNFAHIVLLIQGSDEFTLESHMGFEGINVQVEGNEKIGWEGRFLEEVTGDWSDGVEYEITIQDNDEKGLLNTPIKLSFYKIVDAYEGKLNRTAAPVLLDTTWELTLNLDNEDTGKVYEVNQQIPGSDAVVKKIRLSSISYTIDMEWTYQKEILTGVDSNTGEEVEFEHVVNPPFIMGLAYEDGSVRENVLQPLSGHFTNEERTEYKGYGYNSEMTEYENVRELLFYVGEDIVRVPVEKEVTK